MVESYSIGDGLLGDDGICGMGGWSVVEGGVGEGVARRSGRWKMELPEVSGGGALAAKDWSPVEGDVDGVCGEGGYAAMIA